MCHYTRQDCDSGISHITYLHAPKNYSFIGKADAENETVGTNYTETYDPHTDQVVF
jgi:hypothetical protein